MLRQVENRAIFGKNGKPIALFLGAKLTCFEALFVS